MQSDDLVLVSDGPLERFLGGLLPSCEMDLDARLETRVMMILTLSLNIDESCDDVVNSRTGKHEFLLKKTYKNRLENHLTIVIIIYLIKKTKKIKEKKLNKHLIRKQVFIFSHNWLWLGP